MAKENRKIKSSVFVDLFADDEKDGENNFLALYNAIHGLDLKREEIVLEHKKIPQSIYKPFDNDISMLINGRLIVLIEHQSTPNNNMPLRFLEYYVHLLYGIVPAEARYREKLYKIPTPEFYVFYNGKKKLEQEFTMKLSNAFIVSQNEPHCELNVKFLNIYGKEGENLPVVQNCGILKEYCEFMDIVFKYQSELKSNPTKEDMEGCYDKAIKEAISNGILVDYLTRKGTEVRNMFFGEYDYDLDMKVKAEEAFESGMEQKAVETATNMLRKNYPLSDISEITGLSFEQVLELQKTIVAAQA